MRDREGHSHSLGYFLSPLIRVYGLLWALVTLQVFKSTSVSYPYKCLPLVIFCVSSTLMYYPHMYILLPSNQDMYLHRLRLGGVAVSKFHSVNVCPLSDDDNNNSDYTSISLHITNVFFRLIVTDKAFHQTKILQIFSSSTNLFS